MTALRSVTDPDDWLQKFHAGDRRCLEECYHEHFRAVDRAAGRLLDGADRETVVHEVFYRLLSQPEMRAQFKGGSLGAWLATVARNLAHDHLRRLQREVALDESHLSEAQPTDIVENEEAIELIAVFRREKLPAKWAPTFDARFIEGLSQRAAADRLGISRTTLAYQEMRIRRLLRKFLLHSEVQR